MRESSRLLLGSKGSAVGIRSRELSAESTGKFRADILRKTAGVGSVSKHLRASLKINDGQDTGNILTDTVDLAGTDISLLGTELKKVLLKVDKLSFKLLVREFSNILDFDV
mgnify:CR=1 FL=1